MIINFDQTPESYFRLSENALGRGELIKALQYCEKALEGKRTAEYRLTLADIYLKMGRYREAMDAALSVLAQGTDQKTEAFDVMARATTAAGKLYDSLFYVMGKAELEGDDDTLDAMDEVVDDLMGSFSEPKNRLFLVGKEEKKNFAREMDKATFLFSAEQFEQAREVALGIPEGSDLYEDAQDIVLRSETRSGNLSAAYETAKKAIERDPKNGFALYVLIERCGDKSYVPYLENVGNAPPDLYFAVEAADFAKESAIATNLADRLLKSAPYSPEAHFVAAGAYLNAKQKEKSLDILKTLFSFYKRFPASLILKKWSRFSEVGLMLGGLIPDRVVDVLYVYVKKYAKRADLFENCFLSDKDLRASVRLLFEEGQTDAVDRVCDLLGEIDSPKIRKFFEDLLISTFVDQSVKRDVLAKLLLKKHKGKIALAPSAVLVKVDCRKPSHYEAYPEPLKIAYAEVLSFATCLFDFRCVKELSALTEEAFERNLATEKDPAVIAAALALLVVTENDLPFAKHSGRAENLVKIFFDLGIKQYARMLRLVAKLR